MPLALISALMRTRRHNHLSALSGAVLLASLACGSPPEVRQLETPDINLGPFYFSLTDRAGVTNLPDITYSRVDLFYSVALNSAAGVGVVVLAGGDFDAGILALPASVRYDGDTPVIGSNWMDPTTVDPNDHFSIQSTAAFYYLLLGGYEVVKFQVTEADTNAFTIRYAFQPSPGSAGAVVNRTVPYSAAVPAHYDFDSGDTLTAADWHIGLTTEAVYIDTLGALVPWPSVITNYANGTRMAVVTARDWDDILEVPGNVNWLDESGGNRPFGYGRQFQVWDMTAAGTVSLRQPDYVYIIEAGGKTFKLRINSWNDGMVRIDYAAL